jgi:hypothetical protein
MRLRSFISAAFVLFIVSCAHRKNFDKNAVEFKHSFASMGTVWQIEARFPFLEQESVVVADRLTQIVLEYEITFSDWIDESELRRLEKQNLLNGHQASALFIRALLYSDEVHRLSKGAFNPAVGALMWKKAEKVPQWNVEIDPVAKRFRFFVDPIRLSFGGIVKGMAVGALAEAVLALGAKDFVITAGGGNLAGYRQPIPAHSKNIVYDESAVWFLSRSRTKLPFDSTENHIFDPRTSFAILEKQVQVLCLNSNEKNLPKLGAMNDAYSTALLVKYFDLPEGCKIQK